MDCGNDCTLLKAALPLTIRLVLEFVPTKGADLLSRPKHGPPKLSPTSEFQLSVHKQSGLHTEQLTSYVFGDSRCQALLR